MHVERLTDGTERLAQALVQLRPAGASGLWWRMFAERARAAPALDPRTLLYRLTIDAAGTLALTLAATTRAEDEPALRRFMASFAWLESEAPGSIVYPNDADAFAAVAAAFPADRRDLAPNPAHTPSGAWLGQGDRLIPHLGALANEALSLGIPFGYQIALAPHRPSPEQLRRIGRNLIALENLAGIRPGMLAEQRRLFELARRATRLVDETAATAATEAAGRWLSGALDRSFGPDAARRGMPAPTFPPLALAEEDFALLLHRATFDEVAWAADDLVCGQYADETLWPSLLAVALPEGRGRPAAPAPGDTPPAPLPGAPSGRPPVPGAPPHFFLSYRRSDFAAIQPLLETLAQHRMPVWYDAGIEVGSHWIEVLERKIGEAIAVVAVLSPDFVQSRYCRREVMYADTIGKPIVPIVLIPGELGRGLHFTLHATQMLSVTAPDFWPQLFRKLEELSRPSR